MLLSLIIFVVLHWTPVNLCLSCTGESSSGCSISHVASPVLSWGEGSPGWQCSAYCSSRGGWPSLLCGCVAVSCSACCLPRSSGPSLQSCFPGSWPLACTSGWVYASPGAELCTSLSWTFWGQKWFPFHKSMLTTTFLSFMHLNRVSRISYSIIFPGIEMRMTSL